MTASKDDGERRGIGTELTTRLHELLGSRDAGNGTPLADAVASAIVEDIRAAGASPAAARAVEDTVLLDAAENLHGHLHHGSRGLRCRSGLKSTASSSRSPDSGSCSTPAVPACIRPDP